MEPGGFVSIHRQKDYRSCWLARETDTGVGPLLQVRLITKSCWMPGNGVQVYHTGEVETKHWSTAAQLMPLQTKGKVNIHLLNEL